MFCTNCGEKIDDGAKFCMKCGTAVNSAPPQTAPITPTDNAAAVNKKGKSKTKYWLIFGGIALIVVLFWLCSVPESAQSNVTEVNLSALLSEIENNQARANQMYANKTIRINGGFVIEIYEDFIWLAQNSNSWVLGSDGLYVYFNSSEMTKLANLNKGQRITIRGVYETRLGLPVIARAVIE